MTNGETPSGTLFTEAALTQAWVANPPTLPNEATRSPTFRCLTPSPTARTAPENSDPGTKGRGGLNWHLPSTMRRSEKLRLAALLKACEGLGHIDVIAPEQNASRC